MNNKLKNTRVVTFKEDYYGKARLAEKAAEPGRQVAPIYKKGTSHAIHHVTVKKLQDVGAKIEVKHFDEQAAIRKAQAVRAANREAMSKIK